jgi:hypothetical protein
MSISKKNALIEKLAMQTWSKVSGAVKKAATTKASATKKK